MIGRKLKTLDKILLAAFFFIVFFGFISGVAVNRVLTKLIFDQAENQIISASELMGRTVATEMDSGNFRVVWQMLQLNVGRNNFSDYVLINNKGESLISDIQSEVIVLSKLKSSGNFKAINDQTGIKKLERSGEYLTEFKYNNLGNNKDSYSILFFFNDKQIAEAQFEITVYIFGYVLLLISFIGYLIFFFRSRLLRAIDNVNVGLDSILHGKPYEDEGSVFSEYIQSKKTLENFADEFKEAKINLEDQVKIKVFGDLTRQVAHDIRSPLSALNMAVHGLGGNSEEMSEEKRLLIRNAVQRINDISNDLLRKGKQSQSQNSAVTTILLPLVVESIVSEKRIQYRNKINVKIDLDLKNSFGSFVNANATDLARCISNLVNNSVESFQNDSGEVRIELKTIKDYSIISIQDNGQGIPEDVFTQLGTPGISFGKKDSDNAGSGLGIYHAKKMIEEWGGEFSITSTLGSGTKVEIKLIKASIPSWFASDIHISPNTTVVTVDDDLSIHQIWKGRLESIHAGESNVTQISFTSAAEFLNFPINDSMIFFVDYEFLNQNEDGLSLIQAKKIFSRSILVTSRFEENAIRETCEKFNIKILPKQLSGFVPMSIQAVVKYDYVLIDDDHLIHLSWKLAAKNSNKTIKTYFSFNEFLKDVAFIDKASSFYIDVSLGEGVRGEDVSKQIYEMGFLDISFTTGHRPEDLEIPPFIRNVFDKNFPK